MTSDRPPQNIYDDPDFFQGYAQLDRFGPGWNRAMEHADFMALLPDLEGRRALDLGCGAGQLVLYLAEQGASEVIGVDLSERMLALARAERSHPRVTYLRQSLEEVDFEADRFDLVVSSLALHYVEDYRGLVLRIARWLTPGGVLLYSTEHPLYTASDPADAWVLDAEGRKLHWALDNYGEEGYRVQRWIAEGVQKYHRTMSTLLNGLIDAGLSIERVVEPLPSQEFLQRRPQAIEERRRPTFLLIRARKG